MLSPSISPPPSNVSNLSLFRTPATNLRLRLGDYNLRGAIEKFSHEEFGVKRKVVNEDYNPATYQNDIALLELSQEVTFKQHIIPVCLPKKGENFTGSMATVTGWGRTTYGVPASLGVLQKVDVEVVDTSTCQQWMKSVGRREVIFPNMLCAGYKEGSLARQQVRNPGLIRILFCRRKRLLPGWLRKSSDAERQRKIDTDRTSIMGSWMRQAKSPRSLHQDFRVHRLDRHTHERSMMIIEYRI